MSQRLSRRSFLKAAGLASTLSINGLRAQPRPKFTVVGAGIVGASIAYHLAKAGAQVTLIDALGPARLASRATFAWINATWAKQPKHYHRLSQLSVALWHDLQESLDLPIQWQGSIEWFESEDRQARLALDIDEQITWGEPARMIKPAEGLALAPNIRFGHAKTAAFSPNDGAVNAAFVTERLVQAAKTLGATCRFPCTLKDATPNHLGTTVRTSEGDWHADQLILATGAAHDVPRRLTGIDIPQRTTPGIIAVTAPGPAILGPVVSAPGVHLHQQLDGRLVIGEQAGAPDSHSDRLRNRPTEFPAASLSKAHGERLLDLARAYLPSIDQFTLDQVMIGWRPLPIDGHPVLGTSASNPHHYLAIMHSGVTLAPIVGHLVAQELLTSQPNPLLEPYRPSRF